MEIGNDVVTRNTKKTAFIELNHRKPERMLVSQRVGSQNHPGYTFTSSRLVQPAIGENCAGQRLFR